MNDIAEQQLATSERDEYRYPDFLCIGAQKAGTTWLDRNLRRHPKVWLPPVKEVQYFNELHIRDSRHWTAKHRQDRGVAMLRQHLKKKPPEDWDYRLISVMGDFIASPISDCWYGRIFALARSGQVCGEIGPDYASLPDDGIKHVLKLSPNIRVIFSMRDPIERAWSQLRMDLKRGQKKELGELEAGAINREVYRRSDYPKIIANWRRFIPEENFLPIFMDDIAAEPNRVLESVCGFLGVPYRPKRFTDADEPVHEGLAHEMPESVENILKARLRPIYEQFADLYPEPGHAWMARHYG